MSELLGLIPVPEATKVNKAFCVKNDERIILMHWETCIMEYDRINRKVLSIKPASITSLRAINQVSEYFNLGIDAKKECKLLNGVTFKEYRWY